MFEIFRAILSLIAFLQSLATVPVATPTATVTATATVPAPTITPTAIRPSPTPVLRTLGLPNGLRVVYSPAGCLPDGRCPYAGVSGILGYYDAPTRTVLLLRDTPLDRMHETCHAHQHQTILETTGKEPASLDLREWSETTEAVIWRRENSGLPRFYPADLEDFAETCGRYFTGQLQNPAKERALLTALDY